MEYKTVEIINTKQCIMRWSQKEKYIYWYNIVIYKNVQVQRLVKYHSSNSVYWHIDIIVLHAFGQNITSKVWMITKVTDCANV